MTTNRNKSTVKKEPTANKLQVNLKRQESQQEEFSPEFNFSSGKFNDFVKKQRPADNNQPVSERTAWH
ncbi:hypothetical protein DCE79_08345 [Lysinibacillus sp. 2017]|nr:hypothetical protein DCE79_08345 [Lysinibacillus sp. 2017]